MSDIDTLAQQLADHLRGETTIGVDYDQGELRATDIGEIVTSLGKARLAQATTLDDLTDAQIRDRLDEVCELCRDLVGDEGQPAPVRALAVMVLSIISGD